MRTGIQSSRYGSQQSTRSEANHSYYMGGHSDFLEHQEKSEVNASHMNLAFVGKFSWAAARMVTSPGRERAQEGDEPTKGGEPWKGILDSRAGGNGELNRRPRRDQLRELPEVASVFGQWPRGSLQPGRLATGSASAKTSAHGSRALWSDTGRKTSAHGLRALWSDTGKG